MHVIESWCDFHISLFGELSNRATHPWVNSPVSRPVVFLFVECVLFICQSASHGQSLIDTMCVCVCVCIQSPADSQHQPLLELIRLTNSVGSSRGGGRRRRRRRRREENNTTSLLWSLSLSLSLSPWLSGHVVGARRELSGPWTFCPDAAPLGSQLDRSRKQGTIRSLPPKHILPHWLFVPAIVTRREAAYRGTTRDVRVE